MLHCRSSCSLARAMDGRIMCRGISLAQANQLPLQNCEVVLATSLAHVRSAISSKLSDLSPLVTKFIRWSKCFHGFINYYPMDYKRHMSYSRSSAHLRQLWFLYAFLLSSWEPIRDLRRTDGQTDGRTDGQDPLRGQQSSA